MFSGINLRICTPNAVYRMGDWLLYACAVNIIIFFNRFKEPINLHLVSAAATQDKTLFVACNVFHLYKTYKS